MTDNSQNKTLVQQKRALKKILELKAEIAALKSEDSEAIAVVGMGCRFPGKVNTPEEYWDLLCSGRDGISQIPSERWNVDAFYDQDPDCSGKMYVREGGFLQNIDQFDPDFFGLSLREANSMDPQQRLLLEVGWSALEDGNIAPRSLSGSSTGVYMGVCTQDYARYSLTSNDPQNIDVYSFTGNAPSITSGRISNILNLQGPNITVDTACSSSLVAVHLAIQSLRSQETDLALAGGVNIILRPENFIYFCKVNALSPDGRCKTFDDSANGYVRAEGCGVVVLKRLKDAVASGDKIYGVIRGSAINQDGQSYGLTAPNGNAQRALIQAALADANTCAEDISFVECHGTGTSLGDPIEVGALGEVYGQNRPRDRPLLLGAVKSNIGHTEAAAGMAGLIKTLLCMQHEAIPGNLHFEQPNAKIDWSSLPIAVPSKLQSWTTDSSSKMAGVSAFGFSGTNVHLILESVEGVETAAAQAITPTVFNRRRCWLEAAKLRSQPPTASNSLVKDYAHPLLGKPVFSCLTQQTCYESLVSLERVGYFRSHPVWGKIVMSGSGYVEMATVLAQKLFATPSIELQNLIYQEVFELTENQTERLQIALEKSADDRIDFKVCSLARSENTPENLQSQWRQHAAGSLQKLTQLQTRPPLERESVLARCQQHIEREAFYQRLSSNGYHYGCDHQGVERAWLGEGEILTQIAYPESLNYFPTHTDEDYYFHPALLDAAYQPLLMLLPPVGSKRMYVTLGKEKVRTYRTPTDCMWVHTRRQLDNSDDDNNVKADVYIYDEAGALIAETLGYVMTQTANTPPTSRKDSQESNYYQISWQEQKAPILSSELNSELQIILADRQGYGVSLYEAMAEQGINCVLLHRGEPINRLTCMRHYQLAALDEESLTQVFEQLWQDGIITASEPSHVVYCWGLDDLLPRTANQDIAPDGCASLAQLTSWLSQQNLNSVRGLTVLTKHAQHIVSETSENQNPRNVIEPIEPLQTAYWGMAGVVSAELPELELYCIDLDFEAHHTNQILTLLQTIKVRSQERLVAIKNNQFFVPRLTKVAPSKLSEVVDEAEQFTKLAMGCRGDLSSLTWQNQSRTKLQPHEVEIRVKATGLNLRDIIDGLGLHPRRLDEFGLECSGIVTAVDPAVTRVAVGDEVVAFGTGCFSEYFVTTEARVGSKPQHLSFTEAASIPIAFLTAYHALDSCKRIVPGDRVLIHAAAGGVGIAAVKLALQAGAKVFGTASPHKWDLLKELGVESVANSRDLSFVASVQSWTNGEGVDLILNSLSGEFIDSSMDLLKPGGQFVEIGLKGWSMEQMRQQRQDTQYQIINLMAQWESDPQGVQIMLDELLAMFQPPRSLSTMPCQGFSGRQVIDAFRYMQQGKHIGKIVVALEEKHSNSSAPFGGTQIITGGLGAIGLKIARHLIAQNCSNIVLLSRRSPSPDLEATLSELRVAGTTLEVIQADVSDPDSLASALSAIRQTMPPIEGIYHAAGISDDGLLGELNHERFATVFQPKIAGTYWLHQLTLQDKLRYFVLFSSMTSLLGTIGVGNYAAANAALNSFAHYRNGLGLPATAIAWGPWANTGMFAELDPVYRDRLFQSGLQPLGDQENCQSLSELISRPGVFGVFQIQWQQWLKQQSQHNPLYEQLWSDSPYPKSQNQRDIRVDHLTGKQRTSKIRQELEKLSSWQRQPKMLDFLQTQLREILAQEDSGLIDEKTGFFELGMDSLTSVEFRNRIQSRLSCTLPVTVTYDYPSLQSLGEFLLTQIQLKPEPNSIQSPQSTPVNSKASLSDVQHLSETEIIAELTK